MEALQHFEEKAAVTSKTVGLDVRALQGAFKAHAVRGTGRYVSELNRYFSSHSNAINVQGFTPADLEPEDFVTRSLESISEVLPFGKVTFKQQLCYPRRLNGAKASSFDILHFPAHIDAPSWCKKRYMVTVLDLIPLALKELYSVGKATWRYNLARWLELQAIRNAELILTISEHGAKDVQRLLNIPEEKIVVTPLGIDERFFGEHLKGNSEELALRAKYKIPLERQIVLYVGGIDQRKNMSSLVKAFTECSAKVEKAKGDRPLLVIAGSVEHDLQYPALLDLINLHSIGRDTIFTGFIGDSDLMKLYQACSVFFFPSLYEGFGFTPLEAMACGAAVVSSNRSAMPEVLGSAAQFVNPEDVTQCAEALAAILMDKSLRERLSRAGPSQARKFPWSKTAELTLRAYERVLQ